jgi:predicted anti-sigma-YlaC factor YlaD
MSAVPRTVVCDRVRAQISLRLDGELSQLESRMLAAHLDRCADCSTYEADVARITAELRAAPLEAMERPIVIRRPRRVSALRLQAGVAAALAVAALGAVTQLQVSADQPAFASPKRYPTSSQLTREVNQIIADGNAFGTLQGSALPL